MWVECLFKLAPCRSPTFKDSEQGPFKFLTRCLHLKKYINPNLDLLIDQNLLRAGLPGQRPSPETPSTPRTAESTWPSTRRAAGLAYRRLHG